MVAFLKALGSSFVIGLGTFLAVGSGGFRGDLDLSGGVFLISTVFLTIYFSRSDKKNNQD